MNSSKKLIVSGVLLSLSSLTYGTDCPSGETSSSIEKQMYTLDAGAYKSTNVLNSDKNGLFDSYKACIEQENIDEATRKFAGLNWGIGLAFVSLSSESIDEAQVIDGVVRITEEHSKSASLMLETHYFLQKAEWGPNIGWGPFAAIRIADSEGADIGAFGAGLMIGFKDGPKDGGSWNIGAGLFVDTEVKEFGSGVEEGQALPGTETSIRFKEVDKSGLMIMLSSTF